MGSLIRQNARNTLIWKHHHMTSLRFQIMLYKSMYEMSINLNDHIITSICSETICSVYFVSWYSNIWGSQVPVPDTMWPRFPPSWIYRTTIFAHCNNCQYCFHGNETRTGVFFIWYYCGWYRNQNPVQRFIYWIRIVSNTLIANIH